MVRSPRTISWSKPVAVAIGLCLAVGLAIAAPMHAAVPTTAAERLVMARFPHGPVGKQPNASVSKRHAGHRTR